MKAYKTVAEWPSVITFIAQRWVFAPGQTVMLQCRDGSGGPVLLIQRHDKGASGQRVWEVMFLDEPMLGCPGVFAESNLHPFTADAGPGKEVILA